MRIIGEFDLDQIKVTVFKMNERVSVKFEFNLLEQVYKFRDGSGINTTEDIKKLCTEEFSVNIKQIFSQMADARATALLSMQGMDGDENTFDVII
ncbi:MAG: hypothetical protein IPP49_00200 [Saprospiraceae bacterium]|nr:hypothetical protein [Saprospiraceae bacterium]